MSRIRYSIFHSVVLPNFSQFSYSLVQFEAFRGLELPQTGPLQLLHFSPIYISDPGPQNLS